MSGKSKIRELTNEWYGYVAFTVLVNIVMALFGSGLLAVVAVPLVVVFSVIPFAITFLIGRLLMAKSNVTRIILLVLSPIAVLLGCAAGWQMLVGEWTLGMLIQVPLLALSMYMHVRSFMTLIDSDVRGYFR